MVIQAAKDIVELVFQEKNRFQKKAVKHEILLKWIYFSWPVEATEVKKTKWTNKVNSIQFALETCILLWPMPDLHMFEMTFPKNGPLKNLFGSVIKIQVFWTSDNFLLIAGKDEMLTSSVFFFRMGISKITFIHRMWP